MRLRPPPPVYDQGTALKHRLPKGRQGQGVEQGGQRGTAG